MATTVFPQTGDAITEAAWVPLNDAITAGTHGVVTGFDLSDAGGGTVSAAAGTALVSGYYVNTTTAVTKALSNGTRHVWLASDGTIAESANSTPPNGDDLFLGHVVVSGGAITNIYASYFQHLSSGDQLWFGARAMNHNTSMGTGSSNTNLAPLALPPGLWFVRGFVMIVGDASSAGAVSTFAVTAPSGATVSNYRVAVLPANSPATATWLTSTATMNVTTVGNNEVCPIRWYGFFDIPDGGTIAWSVTTHGFHSLSRGYNCARRIA